jgi:hypothetical protein
MLLKRAIASIPSQPMTPGSSYPQLRKTRRAAANSSSGKAWQHPVQRIGRNKLWT